MEDREIVALYVARDERAIAETDSKYGALCRAVAGNILPVAEDREEAVQDAYLGVWNAIPPTVPRSLRAFVCALTRNAALKLYDRLTAQRRGGTVTQSLEELGDCVSGQCTPETLLEGRRTEQVIADFLRAQSPVKRHIFLRRYWRFDPIAVIARETGFSVSKVTGILYRMRRELRETLEKEDIPL